MQKAKVIVPWREGLHLRVAVQLVRVAREFRSTVLLKTGSRVADLRSILGVLALCATVGSVLEIVVAGDDEQAATRSIEQIFLP